MRFFNRAYGTHSKNIYDYSGYAINRREKTVNGTKQTSAKGSDNADIKNKKTLAVNGTKHTVVKPNSGGNEWLISRSIHRIIDFITGKKNIFLIIVALIVAFLFLMPVKRVITLREKSYFAMEMAVLADEGSAYTLSGEVAALGGGNIIRKDDGFRILAAIYTNKEDALSVIEKNERYGFSPSLYTWEIPSFDFSFESTVFSFSAVENAVNYLFSSAEEILTLSVELDCGNRTDNEISSATKKLEADGEKIINALHRAFFSSNTDLLYRYVERNIGFISEMNANLSSSSMKTCYGKILTNLSDFAGEFI